MKIRNISISRFRGFNNVNFELGDYLTVISGQNGTQKTTLLGLLSQPFSITTDENPMRNERPLSGGSFISAYSDKFKISDKFDKVGEHEWTLNFKDTNNSSYTVESINRDKNSGTIRFWQKGNKSKGSGYIQLPVIFLSLKRLFPIGEDSRLKIDNNLHLTDEENHLYKFWFNKILILTREHDKAIDSDFISSTHKQTLGATTNHYDWQTNSSGQDNLSKILLAIFSFKRLKDKYPNDYKGGILAIDEIDATFYSGSQKILINALINFASDYNIQIILTTHSLTILEQVSELLENKFRKEQIKLVYLIKEDGNIDIKNNVNFDFIKNNLNRTLSGISRKPKIHLYAEDDEARILIKSLLGTTYTKHLDFIHVSMGSNNLIQLASVNIPSFIYPNSIIILDGDVKNNTKQLKQIKKLKNILLLPTNKSPEVLIAEFLNDLSDNHPLWREIDDNYDHGFCFKNFTLNQIISKREIAKDWFNQNLVHWGRNAFKVLNHWKKENKDLVNEFNNNFATLFEKITTK